MRLSMSAFQVGEIWKILWLWKPRAARDLAAGMRGSRGNTGLLFSFVSVDQPRKVALPLLFPDRKPRAFGNYMKCDRESRKERQGRISLGTHCSVRRAVETGNNGMTRFDCPLIYGNCKPLLLSRSVAERLRKMHSWHLPYLDRIPIRSSRFSRIIPAFECAAARYEFNSVSIIARVLYNREKWKRKKSTNRRIANRFSAHSRHTIKRRGLHLRDWLHLPAYMIQEWFATPLVALYIFHSKSLSAHESLSDIASIAQARCSDKLYLSLSRWDQIKLRVQSWHKIRTRINNASNYDYPHHRNMHACVPLVKFFWKSDLSAKNARGYHAKYHSNLCRGD